VIVEEILAAVLGAPAASARSPQELERSFGARNYDSLPVVLVRGRGAYLWDDHGRRYLDLMSAYSAVSHGHCHPRLVAALSRQAQTLAVTSRRTTTRACRCFSNACAGSPDRIGRADEHGSRAVETALKAARKWAYKVKGVPEDSRRSSRAAETSTVARSRSSRCPPSRSTATGLGRFRGDSSLCLRRREGIRARDHGEHRGVLVEPIQGEQGIIVPPRGYLAECERICRRHKVLLIADEVQTGLGRTGRLLACDHEGVKPDGLILGKALAATAAGIGVSGRREVMAVFEPGDHGSTFGGNPLAAAVALEALDVLVRSAWSSARLNWARSCSRACAHRQPRGARDPRPGPVQRHRDRPGLGKRARGGMRLLARGILTRDTHHTVVRVAPPW